MLDTFRQQLLRTLQASRNPDEVKALLSHARLLMFRRQVKATARLHFWHLLHMQLGSMVEADFTTPDLHALIVIRVARFAHLEEVDEA